MSNEIKEKAEDEKNNTWIWLVAAFAILIGIGIYTS